MSQFAARPTQGLSRLLYLSSGTPFAFTMGKPLSSFVEQGRLKADDRVAMLGIGSGINCLMLAVEWQKSATATEKEQQVAAPELTR